MNLQEFWSVLDCESTHKRVPSQNDISTYNQIIKQQKADIFKAKAQKEINLKIEQIIAKLQNTVEFYPENSCAKEMFFKDISSIEGFISERDVVHEMLTNINPNDRQIEWILKRLETIRTHAQENLEHKDITIEDLNIPIQHQQPQEPVIIQAHEVAAIIIDEEINDTTTSKVEDITLDTQEKVNQFSLLTNLNTKINKYMLSSGALLLLAFLLNASENPQSTTTPSNTEITSENPQSTTTHSSKEVTSESEAEMQPQIVSSESEKQRRAKEKARIMFREDAKLKLDQFEKVFQKNQKLLENIETVDSLDHTVNSLYSLATNSYDSQELILKRLSHYLITDYILYKVNSRFGEGSLKHAEIRLSSVNPFDHKEHIVTNTYISNGDLQVSAAVLGYIYQGNYHVIGMKIKKK